MTSSGCIIHFAPRLHLSAVASSSASSSHKTHVQPPEESSTPRSHVAEPPLVPTAVSTDASVVPARVPTPACIPATSPPQDAVGDFLAFLGLPFDLAPMEVRGVLPAAVSTDASAVQALGSPPVFSCATSTPHSAHAPFPASIGLSALPVTLLGGLPTAVSTDASVVPARVPSPACIPATSPPQDAVADFLAFLGLPLDLAPMEVRGVLPAAVSTDASAVQALGSPPVSSCATSTPQGADAPFPASIGRSALPVTLLGGLPTAVSTDASVVPDPGGSSSEVADFLATYGMSGLPPISGSGGPPANPSFDISVPPAPVLTSTPKDNVAQFLAFLGMDDLPPVKLAPLAFRGRLPTGAASNGGSAVPGPVGAPAEAAPTAVSVASPTIAPVQAQPSPYSDFTGLNLDQLADIVDGGSGLLSTFNEAS